MHHKKLGLGPHRKCVSWGKLSVVVLVVLQTVGWVIHSSVGSQQAVTYVTEAALAPIWKSWCPPMERWSRPIPYWLVAIVRRNLLRAMLKNTPLRTIMTSISGQTVRSPAPR